MAPVTLPSREEFLSSWVSRLPQASRIRAEDATRWYEAAVAIDPARFVWHFHRLFGFGGSDIGELAAWRLGIPALFNTPPLIVAHKLLRRAIEPANKYTRRGTLLEDDLRATFLEDFRARTRPDLVEALRQARSAAHPWARANPDDVVEMRSAGKSKLYIVDYKASSEVKEQAPTQYACQTHHYDWMLWCADHDKAPRLSGDTPLATDGLLIVYYDYAAAEVVPVKVPWDGAILRAVIEGGDQAWAHVLGQRDLDFSLQPDADSSNTEVLHPAESALLTDLERRMVAHKLLADHLYKRYKELTAECERIIYDSGRRTKSNTRAPFSRMSVWYKNSVDDERLQGLCRVAGIDAEALRVSTETLDAQAMAARLQVLGEQPIYERAYDFNRIRALCAEQGCRLPLEESGVFSLSRTRAAQEALEPLRACANEEAAKAAQLLLQSMQSPGSTALQDGTHIGSAAQSPEPGARVLSKTPSRRVRSLSLSPPPDRANRGATVPRLRRG